MVQQEYSTSESTLNPSQPNPALNGKQVGYCTMNKQILIQKPNFATDKSIQELDKRKILAKDLLEDWEVAQVQKQGIMFAVSVEDNRYLVRAEDKVPQNAKVVRTQSNQLMGIGAVVGG